MKKDGKIISESAQLFSSSSIKMLLIDCFSVCDLQEIREALFHRCGDSGRPDAHLATDIYLRKIPASVAKKNRPARCHLYSQPGAEFTTNT